MLKNEVNYKALAFLAEQTASTFNYEVKGVRALWDPSLSIPGTNRRGGWRCPVGTRYGGQITDRFGRSCGWGVARRIANQIADIGERLESIDDRKRNDRLAKRNARVQRFLARQDKPGLLERGARGIADALDGGETGKPITAPRAPARPRIPVQQQRPRIPVQPPARPVIPVQNPASIEPPARKPAGVPRRRRGKLRESEQRRMERELVEPGAPRTGEPPRPNAPRRRRRNAAQQGAKRTARRKPEADFVDGSKPAPTKVPRRKPAPKPPERPAEQSSPIPPPPPWNPDAEAPKPAPKAPARPAGPPPIRRQLAPEFEFDKPQDEALVRLVKEDIERFKPNAYNNLEGLDKDGLKAKQDELKREQELYDQEFETAMYQWAQKKNGGEEERQMARNALLGIHGRREKNLEALKAVDMRITEVDAGIEFRRKPQNNAGVVVAPARPKTPDAPKAPASPPQMRRVLDVDGEFNKPEDQAVKDSIERILNDYEPNAYNNLRGKTKEELERKKESLKKQQDQVLDVQFNIQLNLWLQEKNKNADKREDARTMLAMAHMNREKNKLEQEAIDMRIIEIEAGIEWSQKLPKQLPANQAARVQPPQRPVDIPEPQGGFDVSPPISKDDHKPNLIGKMGEDGLPDVKGVPMGNKGIDSPQKAIDHLEKGGDIADVPDDLLKQALSGANGRFTIENLGGGGVNANAPGNMTLFSDTLTGKKYYLKYQVKSQAKAEDLHEVLGNNLAGRFGFPIGGLRVDSPQEEGFDGNPADVANNGRAILFEHAGNYVSGPLTAGRDASDRDIKASDRVRATLLDFVMVNRDRHGGNYFVSTDANGKRRFVPIDPSLGFDADWGGQAHIGYGGDNAGFMGWLGDNVGGRRNDMVRSLREQYLAGSLSRREVTAAVADVQRSIREAEMKNPYMNMVEDALLTVGADGARRIGVDKNNIAIRPQKKMKYITDVDPSVISGWILGL